tara:strand:- start:130 stop:282 length:153 start_codon:yes stop_codon:yes gene_type:complete
MYYRITTQDGSIIKENDHFTAFKYALYNRCILERVNGAGVRNEIDNFMNL